MSVYNHSSTQPLNLNHSSGPLSYFDPTAVLSIQYPSLARSTGAQSFTRLQRPFKWNVDLESTVRLESKTIKDHWCSLSLATARVGPSCIHDNECLRLFILNRQQIQCLSWDVRRCAELFSTNIIQHIELEYPFVTRHCSTKLFDKTDWYYLDAVQSDTTWYTCRLQPWMQLPS